jgi:lysine 2,3-aminomutase
MHDVVNNAPLNVVEPRRIRYVRKVSQIENLTPTDRELLEKVSQRYVFRANDYYLDLIDWNDPKDPIKQLIIPREEELTDWGQLDASNEAAVTVAPGVQHKYSDTALMLVTEMCGAYCRYCFRKRLFMDDNNEINRDLSSGFKYIRQHREISNVLLTGGDPLILSTRRLREIITELASIEHVRIIRIGTKMPAFNPYRVLDDPELRALISEFSNPDQRIYIMAHFDHPRELTPSALKGLHRLIESGAILMNQCPVIKGVNDDSTVLAQMWSALAFIGCAPYYLFQGRPTAGNEPYELPLTSSYRLYVDAIKQAASGLARRPIFSMSHEFGKIAVAGMDDERIYFRVHRSKYPQLEGHFFICQRDDEAYWLDHLEHADGMPVRDYLLDQVQAAC